MPQESKAKKATKRKYAPKMVDITVTQEDLDANPQLVDDGVQVGEVIQIPEPAAAKVKPATTKLPSDIQPKVEDVTEPEKAEEIVPVHNTNSKRTITQVLDGKTYQIAPGRVAELPKSVAERIMSEWPGAVVAREPETEVQRKPWEEKMGDVFVRAKAEHAAKGFQVKDTVGPDRPAVVEPEIPSDANGKQDEKANVFPCPTCLVEYNSVVACRKHQRDEHGT
jgi:hypothetical protein